MRWIRRIAWAMGAVLAAAYVALVVLAYLPHEEVPRDQLLAPADSLVTVGSVTLRYRTFGESESGLPPILWVHGFANSIQSFRAVAPLAGQHGLSIAVDMAGFGLSDKPVEFDYRNAAQGRMLASFLDELGLEQVIVAGHSLGGAVALHLALQSDRVAGLVLLNPGILTTGVPKATQYLFFPLQRLSARQFGNREFRETFLKTSYVDPTIVTESVIDDVMAGARMEGYMAGMTSLMDQYEEGAELPLLSGMVKPTLIVWGTEDKNKPDGEAEDLNERIPGSVLVKVQDAGHYVHEEKPQAVVDAMLSWRRANGI